MRKLFILLFVLPLLFSCLSGDDEKDLDEIKFSHKHYDCTIKYPDGTKATLTCAFTEDGTYFLRANLLNIKSGEYLRILRGNYDLKYKGSGIYLATFSNIAYISYGYLDMQTRTENTTQLSKIFPVEYEIVFEQKDDYITRKMYNLDTSLGYEISGQIYAD